MSPTPQDPFYDSIHGRLLAPFSKFACAFVVVLIFLGGQVKSHEAGLAVPDWPLTYGQNPITYPVSEWTGGIFHEHFHRLVAGVAAMFSVVLCAWVWAVGAPKWIKSLSILAVVAVLVQAVLGGMTVWFQLPAVISGSHATLAQTYLLLHVLLAYGLSKEFRRRRDAVAERPEPATAWFTLAVVLIALVYGQLILGAAMRHTESALAIPDFPKTANQWIPTFSDEQLAWVNGWRFDKSIELNQDLPDVTRTQMLVHFAHRVGALVLTAYILFLAWRARSQAAGPGIRQSTHILTALVFVQFALGVTVIWSTRYPHITSLHVATGAMVLAAATLLAARAYDIAPEPESAEGRAPNRETAAAG